MLKSSNLNVWRNSLITCQNKKAVNHFFHKFKHFFMARFRRTRAFARRAYSAGRKVLGVSIPPAVSSLLSLAPAIAAVWYIVDKIKEARR